MKYSLLLFFSIVIIGFASCRRTVQFPGTDVELSFSQDTIYLDTVFTGLGSSTRLLKVFNPTGENVRVDRVELARGENSFYRMNVNGVSGKSVENLELLAGDSAYIFVEISPDAAGTNELIYTDSIVFTTGSVQQDVDLITAVWDAYYHFPDRALRIDQPEPYPDIVVPYSILPCSTTWSNDKPHVIYGYAVVDSACSLTIEAGTQIHVHKGGGLWVYRDGHLTINEGAVSGPSNFSDPVIIQGDRLEPGYEWVPGQWGGVFGGIFLMRSSQGEHIIRNTLIKNATTALRLDSAADLTLENSVVTHSGRVNIYGGFAHVDLKQVISGPAGVYGLYGLGGTYRAEQSSFLNTWAFSTRQGTSVGLSNFFEDNSGNRYVRDLSAHFLQCVLTGNLENEVGMGIESTGIFDVRFEESALKIDPNPEAGHYNLSDTSMFPAGNLFNGVWGFSSGTLFPPDQLRYVPDSISPLIGAGISAPPLLHDLEGCARPTPPTLGAVEPQ